MLSWLSVITIKMHFENLDIQLLSSEAFHAWILTDPSDLIKLVIFYLPGIFHWMTP